MTVEMVAAERIATALERIATALESLSDCVDEVQHEDDGNESVTSVFNVWKEGESE